MSRDTDKDWEVIGETQPFFGVLANEKFLMHNITAASIEEFYQSGERDIEHVLSQLSRHFGFADLNRALDFGCGVGRLVFAMAKHAKQVVGIDISKSMLKRAEVRRREIGVANVEFCSEIPDRALDWINSHIVFQHIPPDRGYEIIDTLLQRLAIGGWMSIHMTIFRDRDHLTEITRDIDLCRYDGHTVHVLREVTPEAVGWMSMYDYDVNRILALLVQHGLREFHLEHTNHGGCHGVWIFSRKVR